MVVVPPDEPQQAHDPAMPARGAQREVAPAPAAVPPPA